MAESRTCYECRGINIDSGRKLLISVGNDERSTQKIVGRSDKSACTRCDLAPFTCLLCECGIVFFIVGTKA